MPTISVRDLQRNAKDIFDAMEQNGAPLVITRRGLPVAALVAIDPDEAEAYLLASAPELVENRRRAENAVAEGRTTSLTEALLEFGGEADREPEQEPDQVSEIAGTWMELTQLMGSSLVDEVESRAGRYTKSVTQQALQAAGLAEDPDDELYGQRLDHLQALNERLFLLRFRDEILRVTQERLAAISGGTVALFESIAGDEGGLVGRRQTTNALDVVEKSVAKLYRRIIRDSGQFDDPEVSFKLIESGLQVGIASVLLPD
ncbi:type II toxin-antitoxin system Phd/YefM family antitoxin [Specibacter cremeus]|uniref:type II toxin-antitoxin system Phd/YefM family antitoxin n=1 Tax=Specibacter cremeus TaxID=1629051 RepID=UPI0013DDD5F9|nr:type II toxin-antitoxin system Phd/YefM family antitoxin [Specibacter cremeus]